MGKTIRIGIDFGTSYSFAGFKHGDIVMPLISSRENYGVPSVFYYDGKQKLVGRRAANQAGVNPENAVRSVKRKLNTPVFHLGGRDFTSEDVVYEIIAAIVDGAENQLSQVYLEEYDDIEVVITVPVDFTEPMKKKIRDAASRIHLKNGKPLRIRAIIPEPIAAAIEYFGVKKEQDANIFVSDLGGGTYDVAIVRANAAENMIPYEILDQEGDKELGGDDWDQVLANWLEGEYVRQIGGEVTPRIKQRLLDEARQIKEELTVAEEVTYPIEIRGDVFDVTITRAEFERITKPLLDRMVQRVRTLVERQNDTPIHHVILTGGSSYMPQVMRALQESGIFPAGTDIRLMEPERAIAHGAARYASDGILPDPIIKLKATHSYGIRYKNEEGVEYVTFLIEKGEELPAVGETVSHTRVENQKCSRFVVFESNYTATKMEDVYDKALFGEAIMQVEINRQAAVIPQGTESTETLTLSEDGLLHIKAVDHMEGRMVEASLKLDRF